MTEMHVMSPGKRTGGTLGRQAQRLAAPQKVTRGISGLQSVSAEILFLCQQSVECTAEANVAVF